MSTQIERLTLRSPIKSPLFTFVSQFFVDRDCSPLLLYEMFTRTMSETLIDWWIDHLGDKPALSDAKAFSGYLF